MEHSKADFKITFKGDVKRFASPDYNYTFNLKNGDMVIWGKTLEDTPNVNPYSPEIADVEITTVCGGPAGIPCPFCYKGNTPNGTNMSFETFKTILQKFPTDASKNYALNQIAFGVDSHAT